MRSPVYAEDKKRRSHEYMLDQLSANRLIKLSYPTNGSAVNPEMVSAKKATSNY
ncbi:MAG: hypothetical protein P5702_14880 [Limnospira sp. PMC 1291.21]|uniref:Uncharacterized protein n=1 Tax=Limnospira fusiformis PMC 851.14 TaxID=2219512 RepID=A0ABU9EKK9_LIMFS|nr:MULTISPECIES: hypothetical protein [Limnospira]MDC0836943.1 hypothetical protein [Limnoraphis robusta]MDY7054469.1 hypothetical protein [Limnospira fusiformis LS22]QJB25266.1 hypothetical protein HFV01_04935 [Limnospira fusiformis SAG 85.79]MDT9178774.1 hypothetical protein [Limnospira sp. PMC 1238.20]MDT9189103.1 hypothetical protein [Limnospira sp. PMC 894.15]